MKRYFVLGLGLVLAMALVVPAFGGMKFAKNPVAVVKATANKALKTASAAMSTATEAKTLAGTVKTTATNAGTAAAAAETNAKTRFKETRIVTSATASGATPAKASCGGKGLLMGGGYSIAGQNDEVIVTSSEPMANSEGWSVTALPIHATTPAPTYTVQAFAICGVK
jgi:hypothetical protein